MPSGGEEKEDSGQNENEEETEVKPIKMAVGKIASIIAVVGAKEGAEFLGEIEMLKGGTGEIAVEVFPSTEEENKPDDDVIDHDSLK